MNFRSIINRLLMRPPHLEPNICYGQDGEDLVLNRLLSNQKKGFYVDIGAHHPVRFSNTYLFYKRGWSGINIDAMPGAMKIFRQMRPRDINIEQGVDSSSGILTYYKFDEPALNTFDKDEANHKNKPPYTLIDAVDLPVQRLDRLLLQHLPKGQQIDFMTVDVEGKDEDVLRSNDWTLFRPRIILAETLRTDLLNLHACSIVQFLCSVGYTPVAKAYNTSFFITKDI